MMLTMKKLILASLFAGSAFGFAPVHQHRRWGVVKPLSMSEKKSDSGFSLDSIQEKIANFDASKISLNFDLEKVKENVMSGGEFGTRGEAYVAAQLTLFLCIALGGIPFIGDFLFLILGPGLFIAGIAAIVLAINDLGGSLSPWPVVAEKSDGLKTEGLYKYVRHPLYAGVLATSAGFSILTDSAARLFLTAILIYVFELKTEKEEASLLEKYPAYAQYKKDVSGKFFPKELLDSLPWGK